MFITNLQPSLVSVRSRAYPQEGRAELSEFASGGRPMLACCLAQHGVNRCGELSCPWRGSGELSPARRGPSPFARLLLGRWFR